MIITSLNPFFSLRLESRFFALNLVVWLISVWNSFWMSGSLDVSEEVYNIKSRVRKSQTVFECDWNSFWGIWHVCKGCIWNKSQGRSVKYKVLASGCLGCVGKWLELGTVYDVLYVRKCPAISPSVRKRQIPKKSCHHTVVKEAKVRWKRIYSLFKN